MIDPDAIWEPVRLTLLLAATTTIVLLMLGTPLAWWLANTRSRIKPAIEAITALPLVLPPTVLGFYLLILLSPTAPIGGFWVSVTGESLTFSFTGLVVASVIYSLPFAVQPLQTAFEAVGRAPLEAAAMLRAGPWDAFRTVAVPLAGRGFLTATVLSFAHPLGEFGVVLMVGGNIPADHQYDSEFAERMSKRKHGCRQEPSTGERHGYCSKSIPGAGTQHSRSLQRGPADGFKCCLQRLHRKRQGVDDTGDDQSGKAECQTLARYRYPETTDRCGRAQQDEQIKTEDGRRQNQRQCGYRLNRRLYAATCVGEPPGKRRTQHQKHYRGRRGQQQG